MAEQCSNRQSANQPVDIGETFLVSRGEGATCSRLGLTEPDPILSLARPQCRTEQTRLGNPSCCGRLLWRIIKLKRPGVMAKTAASKSATPAKSMVRLSSIISLIEIGALSCFWNLDISSRAIPANDDALV